MLRPATPVPLPSAFVPRRVRPRVAPSPPVLTSSPDRTRAVRGRLRTGSPAAAILEPNAICVVSADRARRRRVRRFAASEVLAVEEHRMCTGTELTIIAAHAAVTLVDVEVAQAWLFCREVRQLILAGARALES